MPRFKITLLETVSYEIEIEGDDGEDAALRATELWADCDAADQQEHFNVTGHGVELAECDLIGERA